MAHAQTPATQYLALKRQSKPDPKLDPAQVKANPRAYTGKAFEFTGIYRGFVGSEGDEQGVLLLIDGVPSLRMSRAPDWLGQNVAVRILCVATAIPDEELRAGWPDFTLLAISEEGDVARLELESARKASAALVAKNAVRPVGPASTASAGPRPPRFRGPRTVSAPSAPSPTITVKLGELTDEARRVFPFYRDYIQNHNRRLSETQAGEITYAILKFSQEWDMDPRLIVATIIAESDFKVKEHSHAGAMGLIQLMPDEVQRLKLSNPYDPIQNVMGGIFLLKERLNKYSGSASFKDASMQHIILALASYNAGEGAVKKYGGVPPYRETRGYVKRIEKLYRELCAGDGG